MIRGTGALLDPPSDGYPRVTELVSARHHLPEEHEGVRPWCPPVADQGADNSCVAYAVAAGLYARMGVEGHTQVMPSRKALWYWARHMRGNGRHNVGVAPVDMFLAISEIGYPPESEWPLDQPRDRRPDQRAMRLAADQHDAECGRVTGSGDERRAEVQLALACLYPVALTIRSDDAYATQRSGVWEPGGGYLGFHEVLAVSYTTRGVLTIGSYGTSHGRAGYTLIPWDVMLDEDLVRDLWAIRLALSPVLPEAA